MTQQENITALVGKLSTIESNFSAVKTAIKARAKKTELPTKVSDLTNDSGFQTASDVATAISGAAHLKKEIVQTLPVASNADANTIYLILASNGSGSDLYDEYMLVSGALEKVGASRIDLSNYYTKTEMDTYVASLINTSVTALTSSDFEDSQS